MKLNAILSLAILTLGCAGPKKGTSIIWSDPEKLPKDVNGIKHIGVAGPVVGMVEDNLIVAAGANFPDGMPWEGGEKFYSRNGYVFSMNGAHLELKQEFFLQEAVAYSANLSLGAKVYFAGGENQSGPLSNVWQMEFNANGEIFQRNLTPLPVPLTAGGMGYGKDQIFFIGGEGKTAISDVVYSLNLKDTHPKWREFTKLPYPLSHAIVIGDLSEKIYIIGGRKKNLNAVSDIYNSVFEMDLISGKIHELTRLPKALAAGTGVLKDNKIFVFGGDDGTTFKRVEKALSEIEKEKDQKRKNELISKKNNIQENHPGFINENWVYCLNSNGWVRLAPFNGESPVTTTAVLKDNQIFIPSGEVRAGVRTEQILIGEIQ